MLKSIGMGNISSESECSCHELISGLLGRTDIDIYIILCVSVSRPLVEITQYKHYSCKQNFINNKI